MSAWIKMIPDEAAQGLLKKMYDRARTPHGTVDNVMKVQSLRPHTIEGHMALYKSVLHNPDNTLPLWFLEVVACHTSLRNNCAYSLAHHYTNVRRLLGNDQRADEILLALQANEPERCFEGKELALLRYAGKLTTDVSNMNLSDMQDLKNSGCDDGEILEVNQVVAYFNYSNRTLNGLGVTTEGDVLGYHKE